MIIHKILIGIMIFISPIFPPILVPIVFSMITYALYQNTNPRELTSIVMTSTMIMYICIRTVEGYIIKKMKEYKIKHNKPDPLTLLSKKLLFFVIKENKSNKITQIVEQQIQTKHGKIILFFLAILGSAPTIPDIVNIRIFRYRMKLGYFLIAAFIGKFIFFASFIFFGKSFFSLLGL